MVIASGTILISVQISFFLLGGRPTGSFGDMALGMSAVICGGPIGLVLAVPTTYFVYIHSFGRLFGKFETPDTQE